MVPEKLQITFSKIQIVRHIDILDNKALEDDPKDPALTELVRIVHSKEEYEHLKALNMPKITPRKQLTEIDEDSDNEFEDEDESQFEQPGLSERRMYHFGKNSSRKKALKSKDSKEQNSDRYNIPTISAKDSDYPQAAGAAAQSMAINPFAEKISNIQGGQSSLGHYQEKAYMAKRS